MHAFFWSFATAVLALLAFFTGMFATTSYMVDPETSLRIACHLLNSAETDGLLTSSQRTDVVEKYAARSTPQGKAELYRKLKAGCV